MLQGNFTYVFESSVSTDYLGLTDLSNATIVYGFGTVSINNNGIDTIRMHIFQDSSRTTNSTCRTTRVSRTPCLSTNQFQAYVDTASSGYDTHFVYNCVSSGQYFDIVLYAGRYEFTSSDTNDVFIFTDTLNNLFFAQQMPVIANVTSRTFLVVRVHFLKYVLRS